MGVYFDPRYEQESIDSGITSRQQEIGVTVDWFIWDPQDTQISNLYDEDTSEGGRWWLGPYPIPVLQATRTEGSLEDAGEGGYTVDNVQLVLGYHQATAAGLVPPVDQTHSHLKDRFVWDGEVWNPSSIVARNLLGGTANRRAVILVTATQVRDDEMVNDPQFQRFAERRYARPEPGRVAE